MGNFITAYRITKENEGGYHDGTGVNKSDTGGETFKGISRVHHPDWVGWKKIDRFKHTAGFPQIALNDPEINREVHHFYKKEFWDVNKLDEIRDQSVCNELFDTGVNMGWKTAAKFLQKSLNLLNRNQASWKDIEEDGKIGNITLSLTNSIPFRDRRLLFNLINIFQGKAYIDLAIYNPTQETFLRGWIDRVELMKEVV